jgi:hypothetical protein
MMRAIIAAGLLCLSGVTAGAQFRGFEAATVLPPAALEIAAGETADLELIIRIRPGYHINSNRPNEDYLIATSLIWDAAPYRVETIEYPAAEQVQYEFSDKPLAVWSGEFRIHTTIRAPARKPAGATEITGRLRYQACNEKACLAPVTTDVKAVLR